MNNTNWIKLVKRPQTSLTSDLVIMGVDKYFKKLTGSTMDIKADFEKSIVTVFVGEDSVKSVESSFKNKFANNPDFLFTHVQQGTQIVEETISSFDKMTFNVVDDNLLEVYEKFENIFYEFSPYMFTVFAAERILTKEIKKGINKHFKTSNKRKLQDIFIKLTTPQKDSDFYLEQSDLFLITADYCLGKDIDDKLLRHARRFGYMGLTNSLLSEEFQTQHFLNLIKEIIDPWEELEKLEQVKKQNRSEFKDLSSKLPLEFVRQAELMQEYILFRNYRIKCLKKSQIILKKILLTICKQKKEGYENIIWYKPEEIKDLIKTDKKTNVEKRKNFFQIEYLRDKTHYSDTRKEKEKKEEDHDIKGRVAQPGKVIGKVRLVFCADDIDKVEEGDIMVTTMTIPDFVIGMRKAAAIITDEGGVLCHAAIVAREFGIPCVIGTKLATQVLDEGDFVEVDAYSGVVHRVKDVN